MTFLGEDIPKLGFGLMRLPMLSEAVDMEQTKQMVDLFMQNGFTYFDTAYGYIDGKSEAAVKTALVERYPRDSFQLATKLPAWAGPTSTKEAQDMFWTSLERTGAEFFDFYLLHNLGGTRTETFDRFDIWTFLNKQKQAGLIKHLGFSIHAKADALDEILTQHPEMEFVQLQINYADWSDAMIQSGKCYEVARKHGKPVIVMEPVKGGALANLPPEAAAILQQANPNTSQASWAIRYTASLDGIVTVLSGMSTLAQMQDNISFMANFQPLRAEEQRVIAETQQVLAAIPQIPCTDCQYCRKGCPQDIAIPGILGAVNDYLIYNNLERAKGSYAWETLAAGKASACTVCGQCEAVCPQSIPISEELAKAAGLLES